MTSHPTNKQNPKVRSLKERQREERTALILRAAYDVLIEKGYYEASIDEIAARVGISKGTIYLHFASKEDLVVALVEQQIIEFLALVDRVIGESSTVRVRLEHILLHTYTGIQRQRQVLLELTTTIGLGRDVIEKRISVQARVTEVMDRLTALFDEGKRIGELSTAVPTSIMVATFVGLMSLHGYEPLLTSGQFSPADLVASVSYILFEGWSASAHSDT